MQRNTYSKIYRTPIPNTRWVPVAPRSCMTQKDYNQLCWDKQMKELQSAGPVFSEYDDLAEFEGGDDIDYHQCRAKSQRLYEQYKIFWAQSDACYASGAIDDGAAYKMMVKNGDF